MGRELARCFQVAMRVGRSHGWANEASTGALDSLIRVINALVAARGEFGLHVAGDFLYLDDVRLRSDGLRHGYLEILVGELTGRGVGSTLFLAISSMRRRWGMKRPRP
jgi:hypothetical protein